MDTTLNRADTMVMSAVIQFGYASSKPNKLHEHNRVSLHQIDRENFSYQFFQLKQFSSVPVSINFPTAGDSTKSKFSH